MVSEYKKRNLYDIMFNNNKNKNIERISLMNTIITYNLKDVLKNCFLKIFSNNIFELVEKALSCILTNNTDSSYFDVFNAIQNSVKNTVKNCIVSLFEKIDEEYKTSSERFNLYYVNKSDVPRTIITIVGELTFKRTYYVSKTSKESFFYIDKIFNLPKYDHFDTIVKGMAISNAFETSQAQAARSISDSIVDIDQLTNQGRNITVTRQSVFNWIKEWNVPNIIPASIETPDTLYVMADEKYMGCQNTDNDIMVKCFVAFEDVKSVGKNRRSLTNRFVFSHYGKDAWSSFMDYIAKKYDFSKIKNICLLGDGASWIKSGTAELKLEPTNNVKFHLCEFHFKQAIHHITTNKDEREELINTFNTKSKKDFIKAVNLIIEKNPNRTETINQKLKYITNIMST